jgi:hypothetical protein
VISWARRKRTSLFVLLAAVACSDSSGPTTIVNPSATIADLFAVDSAINTAPFRAITDLSGFIALPSAPLPLARIAAALQHSLPPAPTGALRGVLRRSPTPGTPRLPAGLLTGRPPVFPDSLLGLVFEWDPDSLHYASTNRSGAPVNGVRFILYETDSLTSYPDTGVEVGSLDIIDLAPAAGAQLRFLVRGLNDTPTFLDYSLTFVPGANGASVSADGFVSNGAAGGLERRFTFTADITYAETAGGADQSVDFSYDYNVRNIGVDLHLASSDDTLQDSSVSVLDYRFTRTNENIRLVGADTTTNLGNTDNGQFVVTVNGHLYATLTTTNNTQVITDANGAVVPINGNDDRYEDTIFLALLFGVLYAAGTLGVVLAIPGYLLGFSFGLL